MDQPSFAKSNFEFNHPIQKLPDIWNCEFKYGIRYLADAKIIHYLCTSRVDKEEPPFLLNDRIFFDYIKTYGKLPDEVVRIFDHPFEGVASLSYLLSGKDLQFAHDPLYKDLKSCYLLHQNKYKVLSFLVRFSISPIKVFIDMLKHMGILSWAISLKRIIINQKT